MDCNSSNISFSTTNKHRYAFDVSTVDMRNEIIASIKEKIEIYEEEIEKLTSLLTIAQEEITILMLEEGITLETLVAYKEEVFNASDAEARMPRRG
jgi:hypothetical protein